MPCVLIRYQKVSNSLYFSAMPCNALKTNNRTFTILKINSSIIILNNIIEQTNNGTIDIINLIL